MDAFIKLIYHHARFVAVLPELVALAVFAIVLCALAVRLSTRLLLRSRRAALVTRTQ